MLSGNWRVEKGVTGHVGYPETAYCGHLLDME